MSDTSNKNDKPNTTTKPTDDQSSSVSGSSARKEVFKKADISPPTMKPASALGGGALKPATGKKGIKPPPGIKGPPVPGFLKKEQAKSKGEESTKSGEKTQGPRQVKIVLDDSKIKAQDLGSKSFGKKYGLLIAGVLVGLLVGFIAGGTNVTNKLYNRTIRDAQAIEKKIKEADAQLDKTISLIDQTIQASRGGKDGKSPSIDQEALNQLINMERPFSAGDFSRKNYSNFKAKTVDALFLYNASIEQGWQKVAKAVGVSKLRKEDLEKGLEELKSSGGNLPNANSAKVDRNLFLYLTFQQDLLEAREILTLAKRVGEKLEKDLNVIAKVDEAFSL